MRELRGKNSDLWFRSKVVLASRIGSADTGVMPTKRYWNSALSKKLVLPGPDGERSLLDLRDASRFLAEYVASTVRKQGLSDMVNMALTVARSGNADEIQNFTERLEAYSWQWRTVDVTAR